MLRAIIRYNHKRKTITVLCPIGHLITVIHTGSKSSFAGSSDEAELGAHAHGLPNRFDRLAAKCYGTGHAEKNNA